MTYDQVFAIVKKHMCSIIDDIDINNIDPQKSMRDYGADSLEIVEIASRIINELNIKVPRTELTAAKNLNEFVEVLVKYSV